MKYLSLILLSNLLSACATWTPPKQPLYFKDIPIQKEMAEKYDMEKIIAETRKMEDAPLVEVIYVIPTTGATWKDER